MCMSIESLKEFIPTYVGGGEEKFYRSIILAALHKIIESEKGLYKGLPPHLQYLEHYEGFLILYRREGDLVYLDMARMLRKASHKIYRIMLKKNLANINHKFLNLV